MGILILGTNIITAAIVTGLFFYKKLTEYLLAFWVIFIGKIILISTILSLVKRLNPLWFLIVSVLFLAFTLIPIFLTKKSIRIPRFNIFNKLSFFLHEKTLLIFGIGWAALVAASLIFTVTTPIFNYDSIYYHIPRVVQWSQNQSLGHFFTNDFRQTTFPINASVIVLYIRMISGGYTLLKLMGWFSTLLSCVGVYALSKQFGFGKKASIFSMFLFFTLPMVMLQSSTTQNDIFNLSFILCAIYFLFEYIKKDQIIFIVLSGMAFGISAGSKYTVAFIIPGVILAMIIYYIKNKHLFNFKTVYNLGSTSTN